MGDAGREAAEAGRLEAERRSETPGSGFRLFAVFGRNNLSCLEMARCLVFGTKKGVIGLRGGYRGGGLRRRLNIREDGLGNGFDGLSRLRSTVGGWDRLSNGLIRLYGEFSAARLLFSILWREDDLIHLVEEGRGHDHHTLRDRHEHTGGDLHVTLQAQCHLKRSLHALILIQPPLGVLALALAILLKLCVTIPFRCSREDPSRTPGHCAHRGSTTPGCPRRTDSASWGEPAPPEQPRLGDWHQVQQASGDSGRR